MRKNSKNPHNKKQSSEDHDASDEEIFKNLGNRIKAHFEEILQQPEFSEEEDENTGLLIIKSANSWIELAANQPNPEMLFDEFWFEGELCILFADTNLGKSILAVQIGNSISKGEAIEGFRLEAKKQMMLYFDFELSAKQFQNRYSIDYQNPYPFDDNFKRIELNPDAIIPDKMSFEEFLSKELEKSIIETNAKVLIVDNLTYLKIETEKAGGALPLMQHLKALKSKYDLSLLVLAHTPKRDVTKPISNNDLLGSKTLISLTDSSFAIGESQRDKGLRYLKQIKVRYNEFTYDAENVAICQIRKADNFLQFEWLDTGSEREHLKQVEEKDRDKRVMEILELKKQGFSIIQIAQTTGLSESGVRKIIKKNNLLKE
ncbi:AAA family ATPase [Emticicia agri]|uniref:LuxR family transcriptional regulator n=1 Tax=Emticicia agri TaxID=2492393 RepID=A0A4V1ZDN9_9BACT|nr:AAA family ATPase [Emticicia agri]RYU96820.1 LuxR family transcriptional regulator [Emticicia agri]